MDYVPINEELMIGSGADSTHTVIGAGVCVGVQAIPDDFQESDESFRIRVTPVGGGTRVSDGYITVLIRDREPDNGEGESGDVTHLKATILGVILFSRLAQNLK